MKIRMKFVWLTAISMFALAGSSMAYTNGWVAYLSGPGENPPNASPATGVMTGTISADGDTLYYDVNWTPGLLLGTYSASHFHGGAPVGVNAPVIHPLLNV